MLLNEHFLNFLAEVNPKPTVVVSTFYKFIQLDKIIEIKNLFNDFLKDLGFQVDHPRELYTTQVCNLFEPRGESERLIVITPQIHSKETTTRVSHSPSEASTK